VSKRSQAYISIFAISILWGTIPLIVKTSDISSLGLVGIRTFVGSIFLLLFISKKKSNLKKLVKPGLTLGPLLAFHWVCMFESLNLNSVAVGIGLVFTFPIFIIFLNIVRGVHISTNQVALVILGFVGVYLLLDVGKIVSLLGVVYGLVSALTIAILILYGAPISLRLGGLNVAFSQVLIAALCLSPFTFQNIDWMLNNLAKSIFLGGILTGLGLAIYWFSVKILDPLAVGTITYIEPLTGVVLSSFLLSETLTFSQYGGFLLVILVGVLQVYSDTKSS
tara:strand:- start:155 stop:991 length:837 start_codon:yes stop_codon:yes gene_type:complete